MGTKAVVLEIDGDSAVVLREGGQFLRVPLRGRRWTVGQEVHLEVVRRPAWRPLVAWAAAAALLVAVFSGFLVTPVAAGPAGYVTVDLDPASVGLVTDPWALVLGVEPLTEAAAALVEPAAWVGLPVDRVIVLLVERAAQMATPLPGVVVIAAAPLEEGRGLPPAVRQAVARAQRGAAVVLERRPETVAAAVIAVDEPQVGPQLGQFARRSGLSVFKAAALLGAQVEAVTQQPAAGGPSPSLVAESLARLVGLGPEELGRMGFGPGRPGGVGGSTRPAGGGSGRPVTPPAGSGGTPGTPGSGGNLRPGGGDQADALLGAAILDGLKKVRTLRQALPHGIMQFVLPVRLAEPAVPEGGASRTAGGRKAGHDRKDGQPAGGAKAGAGRADRPGRGSGAGAGPAKRGGGPGEKGGKERGGSGGLLPGLPAPTSPVLPGLPLTGETGGDGGGSGGGLLPGTGGTSDGQGGAGSSLPIPVPGAGTLTGSGGSSGGGAAPAGGSSRTGSLGGTSGGSTSGSPAGTGGSTGSGTTDGGADAGSGSTVDDLVDDLEDLLTCQEGGGPLGSWVGDVADSLLGCP